MSFTRRRFLTISAAFAGAPALARTHSWQGRGFGADISITLDAPSETATPAITAAIDIIRKTERLFSLYDPNSQISRLNQTGTLRPDPWFHHLLQEADQAHTLTSGLFDPTVQPLWAELTSGRADPATQSRVGWHKVTFNPNAVHLGVGQALTLNGIAQGFATDRVSESLAAHGFEKTLVNIGEFSGRGGPWTLGLHDPQFGHMGHRTLSNAAIATSSPMTTPIGPNGHIISPSAQPQWSTVSVMAKSATRADALSTGLVLADLDLIRQVRKAADVRQITLIDPQGDLITL